MLCYHFDQLIASQPPVAAFCTRRKADVGGLSASRGASQPIRDAHLSEAL